MIKTQTIDGALIHDGKAIIEPRTESYIKIPMPWRKQIYSPISEDLGWRRPVLAIYWYNPAKGNQWARTIRIGWTCQ